MLLKKASWFRVPCLLPADDDILVETSFSLWGDHGGVVF